MTNFEKTEKMVDLKFDEYNFINYPSQYRECIIKVIYKSIEIFRENLCNITIGGSAGKNQIIVGWSDLDFYIILEKYNSSQVKEFMTFTSQLDIHIGTTFYSRKEVINDFIDNKTRVMIYEKNYYNVNPTFYGENLFLPNIYIDIKNNDYRNMPNILHDFRRRYINLLNNKIAVDKSYIKKLLLLLKCILNDFDVFSYGYKEVIDKFKMLCDKQRFNLTIKASFDIIQIINNIENSREDVLTFSEDVLRFIDDNLKYNIGKEE
jgi:hypothetical protein